MDKRGTVSYMKHVQCGYFMLDILTEWRAYDNYDECVGSGKTKATCIANARRNGYVVPKDVERWG